jgi:hypothetical protein
MGVFDRFRKNESPRLLAEADVQQLRETARARILAGFVEYDGFAEQLAEYHEDLSDDPDLLLGAAHRVVDAEWLRRLDEQATWTRPGDYERLAAAFDDLSSHGLVGRMNFTCCQTCGTTEIDDERSPLEGAAEGEYPFAEWAYTFFHQQDAERLADQDALLMLTYSSWRPAPDLDVELLERAKAGDPAAREEVVRETDAVVGRQVHAALVAAGLEVEWNGEPGRRIAVRLRDWRKPLPVRL